MLQLSVFLPSAEKGTMKNNVHPDDRKEYCHRVSKEDLPAFSGDPRLAGKVALHPVYSSYALARDAEWTCRLFVLDMLDDDEEGIGTKICVEHVAPAPLGAEVCFEATVKSIRKNRILCTFTARHGQRLIARGEQEQAIVKKEKLQSLFESLKRGDEDDG